MFDFAKKLGKNMTILGAAVTLIVCTASCSHKNVESDPDDLDIQADNGAAVSTPYDVSSSDKDELTLDDNAADSSNLSTPTASSIPEPDMGAPVSPHKEAPTAKAKAHRRTPRAKAVAAISRHGRKHLKKSHLVASHRHKTKSRAKSVRIASLQKSSRGIRSKMKNKAAALTPATVAPPGAGGENMLPPSTSPPPPPATMAMATPTANARLGLPGEESSLSGLLGEVTWPRAMVLTFLAGIACWTGYRRFKVVRDRRQKGSRRLVLNS